MSCYYSTEFYKNEDITSHLDRHRHKNVIKVSENKTEPNGNFVFLAPLDIPELYHQLLS